MAKLSQIRRLAILINKLSAVRYVPTDALVAHVENILALYDNKDSNYSQRTMQRDFGLIDEMFGIVIRNDKSRGYYIAELDKMTDNYKELLLNFELLSSINTDSVLQKYVLAEHRQLAFNVVEKTREETVKTLSRGSQRKWFTLEQPGSRLIFELHQLLADCGLPDAVRNDLHGIADPFRLGCVVEKLKKMQVHIHSRVSPN